jgi:hypothetical protein
MKMPELPPASQGDDAETAEEHRPQSFESRAGGGRKIPCEDRRWRRPRRRT